MRKIAPLVKGDTVALISPAKAIDSKFLQLGIELFESWGLKVVVGKYAGGSCGYFSGTDKERLSDLNWALSDKKVKAIISTRGGYGSIRIANKADYSIFRKAPKWLVGFSDVTVFHNLLHGQLELPSIHATVPLYFEELKKDSHALQSLKRALFGQVLRYEVPVNKNNRLGNGIGELVGGNLAIIESLLGTSLDIQMDGKILFLEEISEYAYKVDRMLYSLQLAGKFKNLRGLVIGGFTDIKRSEETFGLDIAHLILEIVADFNFPIMFDFPAGHQLDNRALVLGDTYALKVTDSNASLIQLKDGKA